MTLQWELMSQCECVLLNRVTLSLQTLQSVTLKFHPYWQLCGSVRDGKLGAGVSSGLPLRC